MTPHMSTEVTAVAANKKVVAGLEPAPIWQRFAELAAIPRKSGEEEAVRCFIEGIAEAKGLRSQRDEVGNLVIFVPGKGQGADKDPVILQGHMDMVCKAEPGSAHNFLRDPIRLVAAEVDGAPVIKAQGTTLGADNGLGVCTALGILDDASLLNHPPLELLFTMDEEVGLNGAKGLDAKLLKGRQLINMDSEDGTGEIFISCAGGRNLEAVWTLERHEPSKDLLPLHIKISGFPGGHSGMEIQNPCGNAIFCLIDALKSCGVPLSLASFEAGAARNAIPAEASATLWLSPAQVASLQQHFENPGFLAQAARVSGFDGKVEVAFEGKSRDATPSRSPVLMRFGY